MLIGKANSEILSLKMFPTMFSKESILMESILISKQVFLFFGQESGVSTQ